MTNDEVAAKIAALEAEIAALKAKLEPVEPKPRMQMPRFDPTEGMSMPASAIKPMADLIHGKGGAKYDPNAWARNRLAEPGGFGPPPGGNWDKGPTKVRPEEELKIEPPPWSGWSK